MQTKDITIGAEYLLAENWTWKRGLASLAGYGAKRVVVLQTKAPRKAWRRDSYRPHTTHDGILVKHLDPATGEVRTDADGNEVTEVVRAAEVRMAWSDFAEQSAAAVKREQEAKARTMDHRQQTLARITEALGLQGTDELNSDPFPYSVRSIATVYGDGSYSRDVRLSLSDLATLLELAHEAGEQQG